MPTDYIRARSVDEALQHLSGGGDGARVIAGGQSLVPMMNLNLANPTLVVDISGIEDLKEITVHDGLLRLGAGVTHSSLISSSTTQRFAPLLVEAARHIGSPRIRNFGTIGGSLAQADPAAELPLVCQVLEAAIDVVGPDGQRSVPMSEFSLGYYTTALTPGEMVSAISVPTHEGTGWGFHEYARRAGDFAIVAVAALIGIEGGSVRSAAIGASGVSDRAVRFPGLEQQMLDADVDQAIQLAGGVSDLVDTAEDEYVPSDYRKRLTGVLARRAVSDAISRNEKGRQ